MSPPPPPAEDNNSQQQRNPAPTDDATMTPVDGEKKKEDKTTTSANNKKDKPKNELSEEDKKLKETIETLLAVVLEPSATVNHTEVQHAALESLRKEIKSATSSMTSIPKPLKFLKPSWKALVDYWTAMDAADPNRAFFSDILSVIAMTQAADARLSLKYKLSGDKSETIGCWGHEYVRHIAGEVGKEFQARQTAEKQLPYADLDALIDEIVPFFMLHNAEFDAVDLLIEVEQLAKIQSFLADTTSHSHQRVCLYILKCGEYMVDLEEQNEFFRIVYDSYTAHGALAEALRVAIRMHDDEKMAATLRAAESTDLLLAKQLAFILGEHRIVLPEFREHDELGPIMGNRMLSSYYNTLATEVNLKDAKSPEDIYKSHLEEGGSRRLRMPTQAPAVDSAKQNLASSIVSAFVNCAHGKDALLSKDGASWLSRNRAHGVISATAAAGLLNLWDTESGFSNVGLYETSRDPLVKAGYALGVGLVSTGVQTEMDEAKALLLEHLNSADQNMQLSAILGLGLSYCGKADMDILEAFVPVLIDSSKPMVVVSHLCLALGLIFCGTASDDVSGSMIEAFLDRSDTDLRDSSARLMCLGVGLLFLNRGSEADAALAAVKVIQHPIVKYLELTVSSCAYVGFASPLEVQKYLTILLERIPEDEANPLPAMHQEIAVLGIALASMSEELSQEMAFRSFDHVLQYGEVTVRRIVPLALGLLSVSNPRLTVMDTLSKLSHDNDQIVSQNAILGMGLLGAGTNNSRLATALRQLATYYSAEPNHLFLVRIAQGLLHLGKGLVTLSPYQSDSFTFSRPAFAGLLTFVHACLDAKNGILNARHYLLYALAPAIRTRMLMTLDEQLKPLAVSVRVGQRVDTVGQAGKPKSITGFQSHKTPVLFGVNERVELATEEYLPLTNVLEGFVILKKNPAYKPSSA